MRPRRREKEAQKLAKAEGKDAKNSVKVAKKSSSGTKVRRRRGRTDGEGGEGGGRPGQVAGPTPCSGRQDGSCHQRQGC